VDALVDSVPAKLRRGECVLLLCGANAADGRVRCKEFHAVKSTGGAERRDHCAYATSVERTAPLLGIYKTTLIRLRFSDTNAPARVSSLTGSWVLNQQNASATAGYFHYTVRTNSSTRPSRCASISLLQAKIRMGKTCSPAQCTTRVDTDLEELGLTKCRNTFISGGASASGCRLRPRPLQARRCRSGRADLGARQLHGGPSCCSCNSSRKMVARSS
jgi:hypothetical protein